MKKNLPIILFSMVLLLAFGCSKDQEKVDQLEKEVMNAESQDLMTDSAAIAAKAESTAAKTQVAKTTAKTAKDELNARRFEPTATGGFTVQVASGTSRTYANYMAEQFIERGYNAFVTEVYFDDVTYYRVRIGNYESYDEAKLVGQDLHDKFSVNFWIDNNI